MNTPLNDAPTREHLIAFLDGSETIDGVAYGERHPNYCGLFWWRRFLPLLATSPESSAAQGATIALIDEALADGSDYHDLRARLIQIIAAQPSDATAQPINTDDMNDIVLRGLAALNEQEAGDLLTEMAEAAQPSVDLTDECAAFEKIAERMFDWSAAGIEKDRSMGGYLDRELNLCWISYKAGLLANTAQGKTDQLRDDTKMIDIPLPDWAYTDNLGGLVPSEIRVSIRQFGNACALAAKKG